MILIALEPRICMKYTQYNHSENGSQPFREVNTHVDTIDHTIIEKRLGRIKTIPIHCICISINNYSI